MTEFLEPMGITQYIGSPRLSIVPPRRINEIVHGKRAITADTALRLSRALGLSDMFFINMQARYDAEIARDKLAAELGAIERHRLIVWGSASGASPAPDPALDSLLSRYKRPWIRRDSYRERTTQPTGVLEPYSLGPT